MRCYDHLKHVQLRHAHINACFIVTPVIFYRLYSSRKVLLFIRKGIKRLLSLSCRPCGAPFHLLNQLTDFHQILYEIHVTGRRHSAVIF
jgi:hypothetical protein